MESMQFTGVHRNPKADKDRKKVDWDGGHHYNRRVDKSHQA